MAKPLVPNLRLVNDLAMFKTFTGILKRFSVTTVVEVPWIGSCALFVKRRLESHFNVLQCPNGKTSEKAMHLLPETWKSFIRLGLFLDIKMLKSEIRVRE